MLGDEGEVLRDLAHVGGRREVRRCWGNCVRQSKVIRGGARFWEADVGLTAEFWHI